VTPETKLRFVKLELRHQSVMREEEKRPIAVTYRRGQDDGEALGEEKAQRNRDLDPQLVWRGKERRHGMAV
jgi:adenine-specific DNA-methyltransferase